MATTTNYSWDTPDDTDLVKNGAAAIRTLGSSVDTTTKALNPSTTEGDIEYRSATADTNSRLAIGTAGQVLTVNSGATAPEWAAVAAAGGSLVFLGKTVASGASTVSIDSVFSATYNNYVCIFTGVASSSIELKGNFRAAATTDTTSNYNSQIILATTTTVAGDQTLNNATFRRFGFIETTSSTMKWLISTPQQTAYTTYSFASSGPTTLRNGVGRFAGTTSFDGLVIQDNSAAATLTGTLFVYGIKES